MGGLLGRKFYIQLYILKQTGAREVTAADNAHLVGVDSRPKDVIRLSVELLRRVATCFDPLLSEQHIDFLQGGEQRRLLTLNQKIGVGNRAKFVQKLSALLGVGVVTEEDADSLVLAQSFGQQQEGVKGEKTPWR